MKCKRCKKELKKEWKYCPFCGEQVGPRFKFPKIFPERSIEKEMEEMLGAFGFPNIKIRFQSYSRQPRQKAVQKVKENRKTEKVRKVTNIVEPKTKIRYLSEEIHISIILPDVSSIEDIKVKKIEESLEIRAYVKDKMYFKIIPINKNSRLIRENFENKILNIILSN